jgi:hypothetical protein
MAIAETDRGNALTFVIQRLAHTIQKRSLILTGMDPVEVQRFLQLFIQACQAIQPERPEEIRRFFEGAVCFPYDKELLLQAFVYFNIERYLPDCDRP